LGFWPKTSRIRRIDIGFGPKRPGFGGSSSDPAEITLFDQQIKGWIFHATASNFATPFFPPLAAKKRSASGPLLKEGPERFARSSL
jgi:hypothetical protein